MSDVMVIGAGLAGAAASAKLAAAGLSVTVLEARDRAGGRGWSRPFAGGQGELLEFGGAWITPWHHRLRALVARHGLSLRPRHEVTGRRFVAEEPADYAARLAHERALARVAADALLLKMGHGVNEHGEALRGISFAAYLDRIGVSPFTRAQFSAWWSVSGNGDPETMAASEFLASASYDSGLAEGMIRFWADTVAPGMGVLAERMILASGAIWRRETAVREIRQLTDHVKVVTAAETFQARAVVAALGINQMRPLRFMPELPEAKRRAIATGHGGSSFKIWVKMEGVALGTLVSGDGSGIELAFAERKAQDGTTLVVGFGLSNSEAHPGDAAWVKREMQKLLPNARYVAHDWHDWVNDPYAAGTWVAAPAGHEAGLEAENWQPEGRIAFASSDYAPDQAGWFEGAVISGEKAADDVMGML
ncbi:flavin monoamine oxidase family protein [Aestuariivirga sp.]|uniref:flavin monoamine oxidase family protein n=1 Tax=Aestuariivirga sp. TaxID=2650926 RepID=UPI0039E62D45